MDGSACLLRRYCRHCRARLPVWLLIHRCMALHPVVLDRLIFTLYFSISSFRQSSLPWMAARWIADKPCKNIPNAPIYNMFSNSFVPCYILVCIGFYNFFFYFLNNVFGFYKNRVVKSMTVFLYYWQVTTGLTYCSWSFSFPHYSVSVSHIYLLFSLTLPFPSFFLSQYLGLTKLMLCWQTFF